MSLYHSRITGQPVEAFATPSGAVWYVVGGSDRVQTQDEFLAYHDPMEERRVTPRRKRQMGGRRRVDPQMREL